MILVLAGTRDGRELAVRLAEDGHETIVSVVSEYGGSLAQHPKVRLQVGALDENGLYDLMRQSEISHVVDASHPYAAGVSANAMQAAAKAGVSYIRFERPLSLLPSYKKLHRVTDAGEAALKAAALGGTVFLTTGSRSLHIFKKEPALTNSRIIARVLPEPSVIRECIELGFRPGDIVAMQGPFSLALNIELFRFYGADVIITKNAGEIGGVDTKIAAAIELGLPVVVIDRPQLTYPIIFTTIEQVAAYFKEARQCSL